MIKDTVMIVDDALFMRSMLRRALEGARDLDVIEAASGSEAVEKFKSERPGLVADGYIDAGHEAASRR